MIRLNKILGCLLFVFAFSSVAAQILDPVKWSFDSKKTSDNEYDLILTAKIDKGFHVYSQFLNIAADQTGPIPTSFTFTESKDYSLDGKTKEVSKVISKYDKNFELTLKYYENKAVFVQHVKTNGAPGIVKGSLEYMCCNDLMCLPPKNVDFAFNLADAKVEPKDKKTSADEGVNSQVPVPSASPQTKPSENGGKQDSAQARPQQQQNKTATVVTEKKEGNMGLWWLLLKGIGFGLAALLTPCMFPMIPLTVSFFTKRGSSKGKFSSLGYSSLFGLSIIGIFVGLGFIVTLLFGGNALNQVSSSAAFNLVAFVIFLVFGISFLGAFNITLPSSWVNKSDSMSEVGGFLGIFFIALTLVIVSFSCTGVFVANVLFSTTNGYVLGPVLGMFGFSLGIALPFTIFSVSPSLMHKLPKSGGWLNTVKVTFGFLELAFALKFLSSADLPSHYGILKREYFLALWIVLFTMLGFYLLGKLRFSHDTPREHTTVGGAILAIFCFAFVVYMVPGLFGAPLNLLSGIAPPEYYTEWNHQQNASAGFASTPNNTGTDNKATAATHQKEECPLGLNCYHDYDEAMAEAKKEGKPLMVDFTGYSCVNCRKMESNVWSDPMVLQHIVNDYVLVSLYVDDRKSLPDGKGFYSKILKQKVTTYGDKWSDLEAVRYNFNAQPYYVLLDNKEQKLVDEPVGYSSTEDFLQYLEKGLSEFKKRGKTIASN